MSEEKPTRSDIVMGMANLREALALIHQGLTDGAPLEPRRDELTEAVRHLGEAFGEMEKLVAADQPPPAGGADVERALMALRLEVPGEIADSVARIVRSAIHRARIEGFGIPRGGVSPEREAHLRYLGGTDNTYRDAMKLLDAARGERFVDEPLRQLGIRTATLGYMDPGGTVRVTAELPDRTVNAFGQSATEAVRNAAIKATEQG